MSTQPSTEREYRQGPSLGTVIWGAVVVALAALIVAGRLGWFAVDPGMVAVVLLLVGGLGLVVGGAVAAARGRRGPAGVRSPEERAES
ncbi:hypothetical protein [Sinomonas atrocyanea]|uniref:hypothetical protein n=1 Tax=Sinomonas atrocyanea TaxID=37927 RepID=UPI003D974D69